MRTPFVVGNWKLNKTIAEALAHVTEIKNQLGAVKGVQVGVAPPATAIYSVAKRLEDSAILVCGQDAYWEPNGAWTGELSPQILHDAEGARCAELRQTVIGDDQVPARLKPCDELMLAIDPFPEGDQAALR